jgi:hypothetical protein
MRRKRPVGSAVTSEAAQGRGPRPPRLILQRHGASHVRGAEEASTLPANPRRGVQGQADRIGDVRRHGAGTLDLMVAKNKGIDNAEPRVLENTSPTSFRHRVRLRRAAS